MDRVIFPCDLQEWPAIKTSLITIASESHTLSARLLITKLGDVVQLMPNVQESEDDSRKQRAR